MTRLVGENQQIGLHSSSGTMLLLRGIAAFVCLNLLALAETSAGEHANRPVRGVWVANVASPALSSPQAISEFVDLAHSCKINTLYVVVWNRGYTTYPSEVMQRRFQKKCDPRYADFDMLAEVISAAHAKQIRVIAWFEFGFSCSYGKPDGGHLLRKYPHWAARDSEGNLATKNNFQWMNAFHPDVQDFLLSLLREVVEKYPVDGIQGDDRLPACPSLAGYDDWTRALYRKQHEGRSPPTDHFDSDWVDWRAELLNQFAKRMHSELKNLSPELVVSSAPSIYPWSKREYLQDWPTWVEEGWVDEVCPQVYREDAESYRREIQLIVSEQVAQDKLNKVFPGILVQTSERVFSQAENIKRMVSINRERGLSGEVYFYDAAIRETPEMFREIYSPLPQAVKSPGE